MDLGIKEVELEPLVSNHPLNFVGLYDSEVSPNRTSSSE
jgi:hypothetical protein